MSHHLLEARDLVAVALDLLLERRFGGRVARRLRQELPRVDEPDLETGALRRRRHRPNEPDQYAQTHHTRHSHLRSEYRGCEI